MSWLGLFPWDCRDCGRLHWRRLDGHYQMAELPEHYQRIA
jgi:hypothetical protein